MFLKSLYRHYWQTGFRTRLYDILSPEAYFDSLRQAARGAGVGPGMIVVDAGCGSGLLLEFLPRSSSDDRRYLGFDVLSEGVEAARQRARNLETGHGAAFFRANLEKGIPLQSESVDRVVAHFSVYTLAQRDARARAWTEMARILKPGGELSTANPSNDYSAIAIIGASLTQLLRKGRAGQFLVACCLYPLTFGIGLRHIQRQIRQGVWHGYALDEFKQELAASGLVPVEFKQVYGGSGWWIRARKEAP